MHRDAARLRRSLSPPRRDASRLLLTPLQGHSKATARFLHLAGVGRSPLAIGHGSCAGLLVRRAGSPARITTVVPPGRAVGRCPGWYGCRSITSSADQGGPGAGMPDPITVHSLLGQGSGASLPAARDCDCLWYPGPGAVPMQSQSQTWQAWAGGVLARACDPPFQGRWPFKLGHPPGSARCFASRRLRAAMPQV
jgi:hypothetical protein